MITQPFADVGMPANGVCVTTRAIRRCLRVLGSFLKDCLRLPQWTITTMSFFYWTFPWLLPRMQRMTPEARNSWIIWSYWIQLVTYFGMFVIYSAMPVFQFRPLEETGSFFVVEASPSMGYWVARAWPGTRIFVFAMGCLAALNRLEVHAKEQKEEGEVVVSRRFSDALLAGQRESGSEAVEALPAEPVEVFPLHG